MFKRVNEQLLLILESEFTNYPNGTYIAKYKLSNPNPARNYITLSPLAEEYLREVGGCGIITSGAEGSHAKSNVYSHALGNKLDIQPLAGRYATFKQYVDLIVPFVKHPQTAFINFEGLSQQEFINFKSMVFSVLPDDLIARCNNKGWQSTFLCTSYPTHPRHLDIGIKDKA